MSGVKVSCPACGGPISFPIGSAVVAVCPYCRSVVARGDRGVEDLGKVAALVETDSAFETGLKGRYRDVPFEVTGRTQLIHPAGGVWDEWYAAFADGRWGWLAEAQGRFYLTFEQPLRAEGLPAFEELEVGRHVHLSHSPAALTIAEKSHARAASAEGAIPFRFTPGDSYNYIDLSGPSGEFATLDYSETPPKFFLGQEVTLDDLGIPPLVRKREREAKQVAGVHLNCPQCGGALELRAPDKSERVVCPNCAALLDAQQGQLRYLETLKKGQLAPRIPLGSVGQLNGQSFMAIGFMQRSVTFEKVKYFWEEYLLYDSRVGFRWLTCSEGHWNFVEPVAPGKVVTSGRGVLYGGERFQIFQKAIATVENVQGEFYWKVSVSERVLATDYIHPPRMLSREATVLGDKPKGEGEVNWSLGTYLPAATVQKAFRLTSLPRPSLLNVAPNQPFPYKSIYLCWGLFCAAAFVLLAFVMAASPQHKVFEQNIQVQQVSDPEKPQVVFTEPFQLKGAQNVRVTVRSEVDNSWVGVEGDLIQEEGDLVQPFSVELQYYHGIEDGESWQEGSKEDNLYLSALPAGAYRLRLEFATERSAAQAQQTGAPSPTFQVQVRLEQGTLHFLPWILTVLALSVVPALVGCYHFFFARRRWEDSEFSPFHSK